MGLKISSKQLIYIILIQIIIIDFFVVLFLVKSLYKTPTYTEGPKVEKTQVSRVNNTSKKEADLRPVSINKPFSMYIKDKNDPFKELLKQFNRQKSLSVRDFKIPEFKFEKNNFIATTYDLSYESCGKYPSNPAYGVTFSGRKAEKGRTIAVDPEVIPLGSSVFLEFADQYSYLNGWYVAEDTGNKVKGNIIDIFLGESAFEEMERFGSRKVDVKVVHPN